MLVYTFPKQHILNSSNLKQSADNNFKFDENRRKFSKRVENTVGNGEIARDEQYLLFPQRFQKAFFPGASKGVIVWEWVNQKCFQEHLSYWSFKIRTALQRINNFNLCAVYITYYNRIFTYRLTSVDI